MGHPKLGRNPRRFRTKIKFIVIFKNITTDNQQDIKFYKKSNILFCHIKKKS